MCAPASTASCSSPSSPTRCSAGARPARAQAAAVESSPSSHVPPPTDPPTHPQTGILHHQSCRGSSARRNRRPTGLGRGHSGTCPSANGQRRARGVRAKGQGILQRPRKEARGGGRGHQNRPQVSGQHATATVQLYKCIYCICFYLRRRARHGSARAVRHLVVPTRGIRHQNIINLIKSQSLRWRRALTGSFPAERAWSHHYYCLKYLLHV